LPASRLSPRRRDGYAPIEDYAAIGDGRTVALVARDGGIDWLCLPDLDSPSVFAALLDPRRGGAFTVAPETSYDVTRRYLPGTNVLETTFTTADGVVRVTDAMTLPDGALPPFRELARRIEGLAGRVPMRWQEALLQLGSRDEAHAFFWWFMHATRLTRPRLRVLYRLDGGIGDAERALPLAGYRGSRPVRVGNDAATQEQLDIYGDLFDTVWVYSERGGTIDRETGRELAAVADLVCEIWRRPDRGIWEVRMEPKHFTHSKAMCWVALDRAQRLAARGQLPAGGRARWAEEAQAIRDFIESRCWSERLGSYVRFAGAEELDASLLLMAIERYHEPRDPRMLGTIEAVQKHLGAGPLLYRYTGADGLASGEGGFLCCSFWLVEALALAGRRDEAARLMETLLALANDVGLYAEEVDPATGEFLGNFPQGLVHLALVSAAMAFAADAR
jgi:GH15 family glucan-1,4-alpha-glucosidase